MQAFDKAIELDPNDANAWSNISNALSKLGRYDEAINARTQALIDDFINNLENGSLIFKPPKVMIVNITEKINATVKHKSGLGENIKVAAVMEVELEGGKAFSIDPLTKMRQFIASNGSTTWIWEV